MIKLKNWIGLCALLLSLQAYSNEISIQDAWIRPLTPGLEIAMVGMVIHSPIQARITSVTSPAYTYVSMQGPSKSGATKSQGLEFIALPAQSSVVLDAKNMYLLLSGNKKNVGAAEIIPVVITVQFNDNTRKNITIMAQPEHSKGSAEADISNKVEAKADATASQPARAKVMVIPAKIAKPVVSPKSPMAEAKPLRAAPVAPAVPVAAATPKVAPQIDEHKKATEAKPAEQPKQNEASAECLSLAEELRNCDQSLNDALLAWCETSAKSKYACNLSMEKLKKLRN
jgi:copper(I)-binding protein